MIKVCSSLGRVFLALILSCYMVTGVSSASLVAATNGKPTVSSGTLSAVIVATSLTANTKTSYAIGQANTITGNFASLVNFGTIPLASETLTVTRNGGGSVSVLSLQYCTGTWNETTGVCSTGAITILTVPAGTTSVSQLIALPMAAGASWRLRLTSSQTGQSVTLSVTVTTSNDVNTTKNS